MTSTSLMTRAPSEGAAFTDKGSGAGKRRYRAQDGGDDDLGVVEPVPTLTLVFEAIRDLHNAGTEPTRERIVQMTGLTGTTVDDRIKRLRREGMISQEKARYEPVHQHAPARPSSFTVLDDGMGKLEVGDQLMTLVPQEIRTVAMQLQGWALQSAVGQQLAELRAELVRMAEINRKLQRAVSSKHPGADNGSLF